MQFEPVHFGIFAGISKVVSFWRTQFWFVEKMTRLSIVTSSMFSTFTERGDRCQRRRKRRESGGGGGTHVSDGQSATRNEIEVDLLRRGVARVVRSSVVTGTGVEERTRLGRRVSVRSLIESTNWESQHFPPIDNSPCLITRAFEGDFSLKCLDTKEDRRFGGKRRTHATWQAISIVNEPPAGS